MSRDTMHARTHVYTSGRNTIDVFTDCLHLVLVLARLVTNDSDDASSCCVIDNRDLLCMNGPCQKRVHQFRRDAGFTAGRGAEISSRQTRYCNETGFQKPKIIQCVLITARMRPKFMNPYFHQYILYSQYAFIKSLCAFCYLCFSYNYIVCIYKYIHGGSMKSRLSQTVYVI